MEDNIFRRFSDGVVKIREKHYESIKIELKEYLLKFQEDNKDVILYSIDEFLFLTREDAEKEAKRQNIDVTDIKITSPKCLQIKELM